jgi:hypothetical protein
MKKLILFVLSYFLLSFTVSFAVPNFDDDYKKAMYKDE